MSNVKTITVGLIGVALHESPPLALISCDHQGVRPIVIGEIGLAAGQRFYDELTKIRQTLEAAHAVLVERVQAKAPTTPAEFHLARMLNDLDITGDWQQTLLDRAQKETP